MAWDSSRTGQRGPIPAPDHVDAPAPVAADVEALTFAVCPDLTHTISEGHDKCERITTAVTEALAGVVATARAAALREAADELTEDWTKRGRHQGLPGCYSSGYERWLRDRAAREDAQ